jgi:hypothetical protein
MRRALYGLTGWVGAMTLVVGVSSMVSLAQVPVSVSVYQSTGNGAGFRIVYLDPNTPFPYSGGALNNSYPLSHVESSAIPDTEAFAATENQGPLVSTVVGAAEADGAPISPLPTIEEQAAYPGSAQASGGRPGGSSAVATAHELDAQATAYYDDTADNSQPVGYSDSRTALDQNGNLVVTTHSTVTGFHMPAYSLGGTPSSPAFPAIDISKVDVVTTVEACVTVCPGSASNSLANSTVTVGSVSVGGVPTALTDKGLTIYGTPSGSVPSPGDLTGTGNLVISLAQPTKTVSANRASATAEGVTITLTQPSANPPRVLQFILGEADDSAFVVPSGQTATPNNGNVLGTGLNVPAPIYNTSTTINNYYTGAAPSQIQQAAPKTVYVKVPVAARPSVLAVAVQKPPVVLVFYIWECLVMAAAAALIWARRTAPV